MSFTDGELQELQKAFNDPRIPGTRLSIWGGVLYLERYGTVAIVSDRATQLTEAARLSISSLDFDRQMAIAQALVKAWNALPDLLAEVIELRIKMAYYRGVADESKFD